MSRRFKIFIVMSYLFIAYVIYSLVADSLKSLWQTDHEGPVITYEEASEEARSIIRASAERLIEISCKTDSDFNTKHRAEDYWRLVNHYRINYNTTFRCADHEGLTEYVNRLPREIVESDKAKNGEIFLTAVNGHRAKSQTEPQLYILEDSQVFRYNYGSKYEGYYVLKRTSACYLIYGWYMTRNHFEPNPDATPLCGMEILEVGKPEVVYRRSIAGNFYEYDYWRMIPGYGRILQPLDQEEAWEMIINDPNPSRFPFVWRSTVKVRYRSGKVGTIDWDWAEERMPGWPGRKEPRWTLSSFEPIGTEWVGLYTLCSTGKNRTCHTL